MQEQENQTSNAAPPHQDKPSPARDKWKFEPLTWVICPVCKKEVSGYPDGKRCWDCCYETNQKEKFTAERNEYIKCALNCENPKRFTFGSMKERPGNVDAINYGRTFNPAIDNAYLWGHNGGGKTFLACSIAMKCIVGGVSGRVLTAERLRDELTGVSGYEKQDKIDDFAALDVLVIDELGLGSNSDFLISAICNVINARESREKNGLIFTSNLDMDALGIYFGSRHIPSRIERLGSRILHVCPKDENGVLIDWGLLKKDIPQPDLNRADIYQ